MDRFIQFEKLANVRDLGGLTDADGRKIRTGKLFRGGNLNGASEADISKLSAMLELVVDFRTDGEIAEKPDPEIPGAESWHLPILGTLTEGVTREKEADAHAFMKFMEDPDAAIDYMKKTYEHIPKSAFASAQQKKLLQRLCEPLEKGVLWHCTAGKDRTGGFSLVVEEILGVPREKIVEDYMLTNVGNRATVDALIAYFTRNPEVNKEKAVPALHAMFDANEAYLRAFYAETERLYGSVNGYLREALGVDDGLIEALRERYLEK